MSYKEGREYISPSLWDGVDSDVFFDVVFSPKPFLDEADKGKLLLDDIKDCLSPFNGKIEYAVEKPSMVAIESAVKIVTGIA